MMNQIINTNTNGENVINNIEGMDVKMVNVNVSAVVKGLGLETEDVLRYAAQLGLEVSASGKKINNVVSTVVVIEAIKELITMDEVAITVEDKKDETNEGVEKEMENNNVLTVVNNEAKIEGMDAKMNNVLTNEAKMEVIKTQLEKGILTAKNANYLLKAVDNSDIDSAEFNEALDLIEQAANIKYNKNLKNKSAIKFFSKEMPVVLTRRVEIDLIEDKQTGECYITKKVEVAPTQESEMLRNCKQITKSVCDSRMSLYGRSTDEIINLSVGEGFLTKTDFANGSLKELFRKIVGARKNQKITLVTKKSGLAEVYVDGEYVLNEGEEAVEYEILAATASGLGSKTITMAATKRIHFDNTTELVDRRVELLSNSSDGAYKEHFIKEMNEEIGQIVFKNDYSKLDKLFKDMIRLLLPATSSKRMGKIRNYIVVDNISEMACYLKDNYNIAATLSDTNAVSCVDTTDGFGVVASELLIEDLRSNNVPASIKDVSGLAFQTRGGGTKMSSQIKPRKSLSFLVKMLLKRGNSVVKMVRDGKFVDIQEVLADKVKFFDFLDNLEGLFDTNGMKLVNHEPEFNYLVLKEAYTSDTALNTAVILAMLIKDENATIDLLLRRGRQAVEEKINSLGVFFDTNEDGSISNPRIDFAKLKSLNNNSQTATWLFKLFPELVAAIAPGVIKSTLKTTAISLSNLVNTVKIEVGSKYTVVEPDTAPLFGFRLLNDNEIYCPEFDAEVTKVSALRHPMSSPFSVTTFNLVSKSEMIRRITNLDTDAQTKQFFMDDIMSISGYALIPASLYLMQKHDGMDFDIDAMQIFDDKEVVEILSKIADIGTTIDRQRDVDKNISTSNSASDIALQLFQESIGKKSSVGVVRPVSSMPKTLNLKSNKRTMIRNTTATTNTNSSCVRKNEQGKYTLDFVSVGALVLDYFLNPVAPIGIVTTGEYNNALLFLSLFSENVSQQDKINICSFISGTVKCTGQTKGYTSPIRDWNLNECVSGERYEITLDKETCAEVMFRYAESNGSIEDTKQFLLDTLLCNRYVGETSIDSTKNMYKVVDVFNLFKIIRALGSDKAMRTDVYDIYDNKDAEELGELDACNAIFAEVIANFNIGLEEGGYSNTNFFKVPLLINRMKKNNVDITGMDEEEATTIIATTDNAIPAIKDPLCQIRESLMDYANDMLIFAAKELENYIKSAEAQKLREEYSEQYIAKFSNANSKDKGFFRVDKTINSAIACFFTVTEDITKSEVTEIEDMTARNYLKETAKQSCRNFAQLSFKSSATVLTPEEIGSGVVYNLSCAFDKNTDKCSTTNTALLDIFAPELIAFLKQQGLNAVAGEKVLYAINENGRQVKIETLVGQTISAINGHAETEDGIEIVFENKKATFENGVISKEEHGYFASFERETIKENDEIGAYLPVKADIGLASKGTVDYNEFIDIQFVRKTVIDGRTVFNSIIGINTDNEEVVIAELIINAAVAELLSTKEITEDKINFFRSESSMCIHINDDSLMNDLSLADTTENNVLSFAESFSASFASTTDTTESFADSFSAPIVEDEEDGYKLAAAALNKESEIEKEAEQVSGNTIFASVE